MPNSVLLSRQAEKFLGAVRDAALYRRLRQAIDSLIVEPHPRGCVKLAGAADLFRLRFGDYRIVYQVRKAELVVLVISIGHRRDIYR
jgi:mRNA interferase RelE/StbE